MAKQEVRETNTHLRSLVDHMLDGFAYCKMHYENGKPVDFTYVDVNPAFEKLTGLKSVIGKKVSDVIPGIQESNPELLEIYGRVTTTGNPERFETYVPDLDIWFSVSVYCPEPEHFAATFDNITERKLQEFQLNRMHALALAIRRINEHLLVVRDEGELFDFICTTLKGLETINEVWIGLKGAVSDVRPVACAGVAKEYLQTLPIRWDETENGHGPMHSAIQEGKALIFNDAAHDLRLAGNLEIDILHIKSGATIPLANNGDVLGALAIWSELPAAFGEEAVKFLEEVAGDIAIGLKSLRLERELEDTRRKVEHAYQEWITALDEVKDPIFLHDMNFNILRCNKAYQSCAGIPFKQIIGRPYFEIFPQTHVPLDHCLAAMEKTATEEEIRVGISTYRSRSVAVNDENEQYLYSVHILEDITERKQAVEALRNSATRFRNLVETSSDWIWEVDADAVYTYASPKILDILGYETAEIIGKTPFDLMPPEEAKRVSAIFSPIAAAKRPFANLENTNIHKDGHLVVLETSGVPVIDSKGEFIGYRGIDRDITMRKLAEASMKASALRYQLLFESSRDALMTLAPPSWKFTGANRATLELFGVSSVAEFISLGPWDISPSLQPDGRPSSLKAQEMIDIALREGSHFFEWRHQRLEGQPFAADVLLTKMKVGEEVFLQATVRDITDRKRAEYQIQNNTRALVTLGEVNHHLVHATDEYELLSSVCRTIVNQQGYRIAWVGYLEYDATKTIRPIAQAGDESYLEAAGLVVWSDTERGRGPSGRAARSGHTQVAQNFLADEYILPWREEALKYGLSSCISLPLMNENKVFGVLTIYAKQADAFNVEETKLLEEMAGDLAFGVRSLRTRHERDQALEQNRLQLAQLRENLEETVQAIATIVEMRDPYTAGHEARVAELAGAIAKEMGLPDEQVHGIHLAAEVHDLGKIQVPAEILSKPGKLTKIEYDLIRVHPQAGYDILKDINFPWPIAQMVLQHHERIDGSGYPQGLKGEQIILEARILCVADVVEAMHSHRPYRPGLGLESALGEIWKGRGTLYDSAVVDACLKLFREAKFQF